MLPKQSELEEPILRVLAERGGQARPDEVYEGVKRLFPNLTENDLLETGSKEEQLWYYGALVDVLEGTAAPKRLVGELRRVVDELKQLVEPIGRRASGPPSATAAP